MKRKLFAGILVFLTTLTSVSGSENTRAAEEPAAMEVVIGQEDINTEAETIDSAEEDSNANITDTEDFSQTDSVSIDKETNLLNSVKLTDRLAARKKDENVMFSPTSLNFALGMLAQGAKKDTAEALKSYLGTDDFAEYAKNYLRKIQNYNTESDKDSGYQSKLKIADAIWADNALPLKEEFKKKLIDNFESEVKNLDFSDSEKVCQMINEWCDKNTEGLIPEIVTPDCINADTGLCLTNSLYFESAWGGDPWTLSEEKETFGDARKQISYMTSNGDQYFENEKATAFGRNYANGLSFIGILPKEKGDFFLEGLDIYDLLKSTPDCDEVFCKMPRLNFETSADLSEDLQALGLENIFSPDADFSGITDVGTKVGTILQKTKLELDENGTKAAAVTAIMVETCAAPVPDPVIKEVDLTRPFAFLIYDSQNDEVLFMGKVVTVDIN